MSDKINLQKCELAKQLSSRIENEYLELAQVLKDIRDNRYFEPQYTTFPEFLLELHDMSEGKASRYISIFNKLNQEYGIDKKTLEDIGWSKSYLIAQKSSNEKEAKELIEEVKETQMPVSELNLYLKERSGKQDNCEHELREVNYKYCVKCQKKI